MNRDVFLSINDASFSLGKKKLLNNISFTIHDGDKIALVGKNGVGKTTLIKIMAGQKTLDKGQYWSYPNLKKNILEQKKYFYSNKTPFKFLIESKLQDDDFEEYNIMRVIEKLKLNGNTKINNLSGGEKRKLALAEILLKTPNLILLDEPTNHLDIESINWLESYLKNEFKGALLVISHNRDFLSKITNKVFWMDRGSIKISSKGFYNFDSWKNDLIEQEKRELKNKKNFLDDEIAWLNRGVKARRKRNIRRKENIHLLKNTYKEENRDFLKSISKVHIPTDPSSLDNGPNLLISFVNVMKTFESNKGEINVLKNFNYKFMREEKIGIIGKNGSGKSTFLNLASKKIQPTHGSIKIKQKVDFSFFDQTGDQFDDKKSIKKNLIHSGGDYIDVGDKKIHICGYLKNFLFDPKDVDRSVSTLSGGERNRLLLAKILAAPKEILILDEPTNDLDIETIDLLINFINLHNCSALISSHDIDFLRKTCEKFFIFDGSGIIKLSNSPLLNSTTNKEKEKKSNTIKKKKPESIEKQINKILKKIEKKENEIFDLTQKLQSQVKINDKNYKKIITDLEQAQLDLEFLEKEWIDFEENSIR